MGRPKKNDSNNATDETMPPTNAADLMDETASPPLNLAPAAAPATASGSLVVDRIRSDMDLAGEFEVKHVGGSLPLIKFEKIGQSFSGAFLMREPETDEREFGILVFDVVDERALAQGKDPTKSLGEGGAIKCRAQTVESTALAPFFSKAAPGTLVRLIYQGSVPTKRGQSDMKLITVESITRKAAKAPA